MATLEEEIVRKNFEFPTLPAMAMEIMRIQSDAGSSMSDLEKIVRQDIPLAAKVLRMSNSAYTSISRRLTDLKEAIVYLGFDNVKSLAVALTVVDTFQKSKKEVGTYFREEFWIHSYCTAAVANDLCKKQKGLDSSIAFVVGLLHDIGKLALEMYDKKKYSQVIKMTSADQIPMVKAEKEVLGSNHAKVGGKLTEKWGLANEVVIGIQYHHLPKLAPPSGKPYAMIGNVADYLVNLARPSPDLNPNPEIPADVVWTTLNMIPDIAIKDTEKTIEKAGQAMEGMLKKR